MPIFTAITMLLALSSLWTGQHWMLALPVLGLLIDSAIAIEVVEGGSP